jgi:hypothetical protein
MKQGPHLTCRHTQPRARTNEHVTRYAETGLWRALLALQLKPCKPNIVLRVHSLALDTLGL